MSTAVLQLHHREAFERDVTRALLAGAVAGAIQLAVARWSIAVPFAFVVTAAAALVTADAALVTADAALVVARGSRLERVALCAAAVVLTGLPWLFGLAPGWTVALSAGAAGLVRVRSRWQSTTRPGAINLVVGAALTALLGLIALEVTGVLRLRLAEIQTPALIAAGVLGAVFALFLAIGSLPAHLSLSRDPVEARCEELLPRLSGDFQALALRALELYRQCGDAMGKLPRNREREELARTLSRMTQSAVELASEWSGVDQELEERTQQELMAEIADLEQTERACRDELARRQLRMAAEALREECTRLDELKLRRERILAKLKAQVALLERARVSLLSLRSGQAQIRATELSALSRKFSSLSDLQSAEAKIVDEVATGAEIAHQESEAARRTSC